MGQTQKYLGVSSKHYLKALVSRKTLFGVIDHLRPIIPEWNINGVFVHKVAKTKCKQPTHGYTMGGSV